MIFDEESIKARHPMNTFSKSFGEMFKQCPLKAWFYLRNKKQDSSKALEVGKLTHELFAQKINRDFKNIDYKISKNYDSDVKFESKVMMSRVNLDRIIQKDDEVLAVEEFHKVFLKNGVELVGIFDLVLLKNSTEGPYIQVFDLKTSRVVSKEVDLQCMIYVYLASKIYPGLPINFTLYSSRTGDSWGKFFKKEEIDILEDIIVEESSKVKEVVESEYKPVPTCSEKCINCKFFDECPAGQDYNEDDVSSLMNSLIWAETRGKIIKEKLKNLRNESDVPLIASNGYKVDYTEYKTNRISTKKVTKQDLIILLSKSEGGLEEIIGSLDISLTDAVINKARELGIEIKTNIVRKSSIIKSSSEEEGEEE